MVIEDEWGFVLDVRLEAPGFEPVNHDGFLPPLRKALTVAFVLAICLGSAAEGPAGGWPLFDAVVGLIAGMMRIRPSAHPRLLVAREVLGPERLRKQSTKSVSRAQRQGKNDKQAKQSSFKRSQRNRSINQQRRKRDERTIEVYVRGCV